MKATIEISLYPLSEKYGEIVHEFINDLRAHDDIAVEPNGLGTQVFGELEQIFPLLEQLFLIYLKKYNAVFVMKLTKGHRRYTG